MPLLDHFHPPISELRHWESFHAAWATEIMRTLNRRVLPANCFAEAQVHLSSRVEIDVETFSQPQGPDTPKANGNGGVAVQRWAPPEATATIHTIFPSECAVHVFHESGGAKLVGAIELVSPGNKDRAEVRKAFAIKCAAYLQKGIGLVMIDTVTDRRFNLHNELLGLLAQDSNTFTNEDVIYSVAYQPFGTSDSEQIRMWEHPLSIGKALPTVPLALRGVALLPLDLESTYESTRADCLL